jgi:hypothetical protein
MGQNAIEDALLASFHIINIAELSARRGIYKNGMTSSLRPSTVVGNPKMMHQGSSWNFRFILIIIIRCKFRYFGMKK